MFDWEKDALFVVAVIMIFIVALTFIIASTMKGDYHMVGHYKSTVIPK